MSDIRQDGLLFFKRSRFVHRAFCDLRLDCQPRTQENAHIFFYRLRMWIYAIYKNHRRNSTIFKTLFPISAGCTRTEYRTDYWEKKSDKINRFSDFIINNLILCKSGKLIILLYPFVSTGAQVRITVDFHKMQNNDWYSNWSRMFLDQPFYECGKMFCAIAFF